MCCFWTIFSQFREKTTFLSVLRFWPQKLQELLFTKSSCVEEILSKSRSVDFASFRNLDRVDPDFEASKCVRVGHISTSKFSRVDRISNYPISRPLRSRNPRREEPFSKKPLLEKCQKWQISEKTFSLFIIFDPFQGPKMIPKSPINPT